MPRYLVVLGIFGLVIVGMTSVSLAVGGWTWTEITGVMVTLWWGLSLVRHDARRRSGEDQDQ